MHVLFGMMNKVYGESIGKTISQAIERDIDKVGAWWGPFLRVRVSVDITKPLLPSSLINPSRKPLWVAFKYERLPNFCFRCGIIKHSNSRCPNSAFNSKLHEKGQSQYGIWLSASNLKGNRKGSHFNSNKNSHLGSSSVGHTKGREVVVEQTEDINLQDNNKTPFIQEQDFPKEGNQRGQ